MTQSPDDANGAAPDVLIHPPVLFALSIAAGLLLAWLVPIGGKSVGPRELALLPVGIGGAFIYYAWQRMRAADTNMPTFQPATALVTDGIFAWSRNPIYIGLVLIHFGIGLGLPNVWVTMLTVPFAFVLHYGVILREEAYLTELFGEPYRAYMTRTKRWM